MKIQEKIKFVEKIHDVSVRNGESVREKYGWMVAMYHGLDDLPKNRDELFTLIGAAFEMGYSTRQAEEELEEDEL